MKKDDFIAAMNFDELIAMIESARARAWQAVNSELVALYWNVGKWLSDKCAKANCGDKTIRSIAEHIAKKCPDLKGFSRAGLYRMRQFYEFYKEDEIVSPLVRQIDWTHHLIVMARSMSPTMVASYQLMLPDKKILQDRLRQITELVLEDKPDLGASMFRGRRRGGREIKLRQAFADFIFITNTDGSGKAASYVRALDMLGPRIDSAVQAFVRGKGLAEIANQCKDGEE